jgi:hypothetical protein
LKRHLLSALLLLVVLTVSGGAGCPRFLRDYPSAGARVLPVSPSFDDVMSLINENQSRIQTLYTSDASVSLPLVPALRASIAVERPGRFRMRAETGLTGPEVDLGSNESLFWFWVRRMQPQAVYFCQHEQFATSPARQMFPIEPQWLIEALGVTGFDPAAQHAGPTPVVGGRLEIRTQLPRPEGMMIKTTIVDATRGWIMEQHLFDPRGVRLASALTSQHWRDPLSEVTLPRHIEVRLPATQTTVKIDISRWQINEPVGDPAKLFQMPMYPGYPPVNVGDPRFQFPTLESAAEEPQRQRIGTARQ